MSTVREPLDKVNKEHKDLDPFEVIMYTMGLSFAIEGTVACFTPCIPALPIFTIHIL